MKVQKPSEKIILIFNKALVPDDPKKRIQSVFKFRIRLENKGNYQE